MTVLLLAVHCPAQTEPSMSRLVLEQRQSQHKSQITGPIFSWFYRMFQSRFRMALANTASSYLPLPCRRPRNSRRLACCEVHNVSPHRIESSCSRRLVHCRQSSTHVCNSYKGKHHVAFQIRMPCSFASRLIASSRIHLPFSSACREKCGLQARLLHHSQRLPL